MNGAGFRGKRSRKAAAATTKIDDANDMASTNSRINNSEFDKKSTNKKTREWFIERPISSNDEEGDEECADGKNNINDGEDNSKEAKIARFG